MRIRHRIRGAIPPRSRQAFILAILLFGSIGCYALIARFVFSYVEVTGTSMVPTLEEGEQYAVHRWFMLTGEPERHSIVAIRDPLDEGLSVKRIVGMPLERIEFKNRQVFIDDIQFEESYLSAGTHTLPIWPYGTSFTLGEDQYFVLGDNRQDSVDSRYYGPIHRDRMLGMIYP